VGSLLEATRGLKCTPERALHVCADCGASFPEGKPLQPIERFWERVEAGDVVPSGQCPECGGLCYLQGTGSEGERNL